jgi:C4-dicarboxylate-specific signal transduction histidine kinase
LSFARPERTELNQSLQTRIAEAVEELRQKDQMLVLHDRFAVMGEMINNIAHQWRQPLNTLGLVIQQAPAFYGSDEFNLEFLKKNAAQGMELIQSMSHTIDDFMNFFRSDKKVVAFNVNQVINRTLSLIKKSFEDQGVTVVFHPDGDPVAHGFPNEYSQVLLNIFMNARDALIANDVADALISVHTFARGSTSVVTIIDNGGGVPNEIIDRLFDPYFTTKGPDKGTGIGLFRSKTIIDKNMGGKLTVRNIGRGAEFRIEV